MCLRFASWNEILYEVVCDCYHPDGVVLDLHNEVVSLNSSEFV